MDMDIGSPREKRTAFGRNLSELAAHVREASPSAVEHLIKEIDERDTVFDHAVSLMVGLARQCREAPADSRPDGGESMLSAPDLAVLADKMATLADQVEEAGEGSVWRCLMIAEDLGNGFLEQLEVVLEHIQPPDAEEIAERQKHQEILVAAESLAAAPHQWPPVAQEEFVLTIAVPSGPAPDHRPYLVLRAGDQVLYRHPTQYGHYPHLANVCRQALQRYRGRIRDVAFAPGAKDSLTWNDMSGDAAVRKSLRPLRKEIERTRKHKLAQAQKQERLDSGSHGGDDQGGQQ